jgi:hypothetical protein
MVPWQCGWVIAAVLCVHHDGTGSVSTAQVGVQGFIVLTQPVTVIVTV